MADMGIYFCHSSNFFICFIFEKKKNKIKNVSFNFVLKLFLKLILKLIFKCIFDFLFKIDFLSALFWSVNFRNYFEAQQSLTVKIKNTLLEKKCFSK